MVVRYKLLSTGGIGGFSITNAVHSVHGKDYKMHEMVLNPCMAGSAVPSTFQAPGSGKPLQTSLSLQYSHPNRLCTLYMQVLYVVNLPVSLSACYLSTKCKVHNSQHRGQSQFRWYVTNTKHDVMSI